MSRVDQLILQKFIEEGYYERHLNKMRALYKNRHDILLSSLKKMGNMFQISGEHAGVHLLLEFQDKRSEEELIMRAEKKGIRVYGLSQYCVKDHEKERDRATILLGLCQYERGCNSKGSCVVGRSLESVKSKSRVSDHKGEDQIHRLFRLSYRNQ